MRRQAPVDKIIYNRKVGSQMPRKARQNSISGYYHIIFRGVNRQDIFLDDKDRLKFLDRLDRYCRATEVELVIFCLMDNHVHLLVRSDAAPSLMVKKLLCSYVYYFNRKNERVGHLFDARYLSIPLETPRAILAVARYILRNPLKAGIGTVQGYRWSSWKVLDFVGRELPETGVLSLSPFSLSLISSLQPIIELAGGKQKFIEFVLADDDDGTGSSGDSSDSGGSGEDEYFFPNGYDDFRPQRKWTEEQALALIRRISGLQSPMSIASLPKDTRKDLLRRFKKNGISIRQISRLTGIDRNSIQRA